MNIGSQLLSKTWCCPYRVIFKAPEKTVGAICHHFSLSRSPTSKKCKYASNRKTRRAWRVVENAGGYFGSPVRAPVRRKAFGGGEEHPFEDI